MLVNLSPKPTFRAESEKWAKEYKRYEISGYTKKERMEFKIEKVKSKKFHEIFVPTEICGVYRQGIAYIDGNVINRNCRQHALYDNKFFRRLRNIESLKDRVKYEENCWYYGVADNVEQVVDFYNKNEEGIFSGNHVIMYFDVYRHKDSPCSGWRWKKWGPYIGTKNSRAEYLNDEPEIDHVICFSIYKVV